MKTSLLPGDLANCRTQAVSSETRRIEHADTRLAADIILNQIEYSVAVFGASSGRLIQSNRAFRQSFSFVFDDKGHDLTIQRFERDFQCSKIEIEHRSRPTTEQNSTGGKPFSDTPFEVMHLPSGCWYSGHRKDLLIDGVAVHILCLEDITEKLRLAERQHSQRQQMLFTSKVMSIGEMSATLAHELNQPIGSVVNYLSGMLLHIKKHADIDPALMEPLLNAKKQAERAANIIHRIRQFVRSREPKFQWLDVPDLAATVVTLIEPESKKSGIQIRLDIPRDLPKIRADRLMMEQVLHNLVKNAIESMTGSSPELRKAIAVSARALPSQLMEISVKDSGHGLSLEAENQLFSPFFTTKVDGLGIGLNICRSMVEYHGGALTFGNNFPESGSTFLVSLPLHQING